MRVGDWDYIRDKLANPNYGKTVGFKWKEPLIDFYKHYEFWVDNGSWELKEFKTRVPKKVFRSKGGVLPKWFTDKLPLKTSSICRLVGKCPFKVPYRPGKIMSPNSLYVKFLLDSNISYRKDKSIVFPGTFDFNSANLVTMASKPKVTMSYEQLLNGIKNRSHIDLCLPKLSGFIADDVLDVRINPKAYSGIMTSKFFGHKMQKSVEFTKPVARDWLAHIMDPSKPILPDVSLWAVGGREKRVNVNTDYPEQKRTRLILQPEDTVKLIGSIAAQQITKGIQCLNSGALYIARTFESGQYFDFVDEMCDDFNNGVIDADWSQYDNHVYEELIVTAFGIARSCYPAGVQYDRYFQWLCGSFIFKHIVLPGNRLVFRIDKGIPSGHPFTSIIGTIVNWLIWSTALSETVHSKYALNSTRLKCCGDDTLLKAPYFIVARLQDFVTNKSGMKCDPFVHRMGPLWSNNEMHSKVFLKKIFKFGMPGWRMSDLYDNLRYPVKGMQSPVEELRRLRDFLLTAPFNETTSVHIINYYNWICRRVYVSKGGAPPLGLLLESKLKNIITNQNMGLKWFNSPKHITAPIYKSDEEWLYMSRRCITNVYKVIPAYAYAYACITINPRGNSIRV